MRRALYHAASASKVIRSEAVPAMLAGMAPSGSGNAAVGFDDERLGQILRAIRGRFCMTQEVLAAKARVPVHDVIAVENGRAGDVRLDRIRRMLEAVDGRARLTTWWGGAAADRIIDWRHAALVESALAILKRRDWELASEVTYSRYGERGAIEVFGGQKASLAVIVGEVKAWIGSLEEMNRTLDAKERLAPQIAVERFGFRPRVVGKVLILPEDRTLRRLVDRHASTFGSVYPARGREIREWLHHPDRPLQGIWFLSELRNARPPTRNTGEDLSGRRRSQD